MSENEDFLNQNDNTLEGQAKEETTTSSTSSSTLTTVNDINNNNNNNILCQTQQKILWRHNRLAEYLSQGYSLQELSAKMQTD